MQLNRIAPAVLGYGFTTRTPGPIWTCASKDVAREVVAEAPHLRIMERTADGWMEAPELVEPTVHDAAREDREYWTDRYDHAG